MLGIWRIVAQLCDARECLRGVFVVALDRKRNTNSISLHSLLFLAGELSKATGKCVGDAEFHESIC
jgi:hypothetical protein